MSKFNSITALIFVLIAVFSEESNAQRTGFRVFGDSLKVYNALTFAPDGRKLYTSELERLVAPNGEVTIARWGKQKRPKTTLYEYDLLGDSLLNKKKLPFANDSLDYAPHINFSGNRIYFTSRRPVPGTDSLDGKGHVWYSELLEGGKWSDAIYIHEINTPNYWSAYAQELSDGSLVFQSGIPGSREAEDESITLDFWKSEYKDGIYQKPVNLSSLNSSIHEDQLVINKNGRLIIFTRFDQQQMSAFYSIKIRGEWEEPKQLHLTDAPGFMEHSPMLSPDDQTFFFAHGQLVMSISLDKILTKEELQLIKE